MIADGFVSDFKRVCALDAGFIQKKICKPFIKAFPHDFVNQPCYITESISVIIKKEK